MTTRSELETKIINFAASHSPVLPLSLQGKKFTRPDQTTDNLWLECYLQPMSTVGVTTDALRNRERGLWCVTCWRTSGYGMGKLETLAEEIISLYPVVPKTGTVSIEQPGSKSQATITDDGWVAIHITFPYRVESSVI